MGAVARSHVLGTELSSCPVPPFVFRVLASCAQCLVPMSKHSAASEELVALCFIEQRSGGCVCLRR